MSFFLHTHTKLYIVLCAYIASDKMKIEISISDNVNSVEFLQVLKEISETLNGFSFDSRVVIEGDMNF